MNSILLILSTLGFLFEQNMHEEISPVQWTFDVEQSDSARYNVQLMAAIDEGWYLYAQEIPEDGPIPTTISFVENEAITFQGTIQEEGEVTWQGIDPMFDVELVKYGKSALFSQAFLVKESVHLEGSITFMCCTDNMCLPPTAIDFEILVP